MSSGGGGCLLPVLVMVLFGIPSTVLLITARKKLKDLAEDDEAGAEKVDGLLNAAMIVNTFHQLADFFVLPSSSRR